MMMLRQKGAIHIIDFAALQGEFMLRISAFAARYALDGYINVC
jgi:hypothetical protein